MHGIIVKANKLINLHTIKLYFRRTKQMMHLYLALASTKVYNLNPIWIIVLTVCVSLLTISLFRTIEKHLNTTLYEEYEAEEEEPYKEGRKAVTYSIIYNHDTEFFTITSRGISYQIHRNCVELIPVDEGKEHVLFIYSPDGRNFQAKLFLRKEKIQVFNEYITQRT